MSFRPPRRDKEALGVPPQGMKRRTKSHLCRNFTLRHIPAFHLPPSTCGSIRIALAPVCQGKCRESIVSQLRKPQKPQKDDIMVICYRVW
jgi:hypothetical protein